MKQHRIAVACTAFCQVVTVSCLITYTWAHHQLLSAVVMFKDVDSASVYSGICDSARLATWVFLVIAALLWWIITFRWRIGGARTQLFWLGMSLATLTILVLGSTF